MTKDLTTGKPLTLILGFALPTLVGVLFQQFYTMVDTMIVGRLLDTYALAAVGSTGSLFFMVIGFVIGVTSGFAIPVAQRMGGEQYSLMRRFVANAFYLSAIFALLLTTITVVFCRPILLAMKTPEDIYQGAYAYIIVIFWGIPATFLYNLTACLIRALGDSKTPVYFLALSSVINIALDYVFIAHTPLGVAGAGLATVVAQAISGFACLIYMKKKYPILAMTPLEKHPNAQCCRTLCYMGLPMGLQYSITAIGTIVLQSAVNGLGSVAVGANTAASKFSLLFWSPGEALGSTMATYCGQNVGAMKLDRIKQGVITSCVLGSIYSVIIYIFIYFFSPQMMLLFINPEEAQVDIFLEMSVEYMRVCNFFLIPLMVLNVTRFSIQGMGFSNFAMIAGVLEMIARIWVAFSLVPAYGYTAACFSGPVAWLAADIFLIPAVYYCIRRLKKKNSSQMEGYIY